jgi:dTDP-4-dehydrorhamnose 3,5-epimerase
MKIIKTNFRDLFLYKRDTHKDNRGYFRELFTEKFLKIKFPFDMMSFSKKNVLRGLHLQHIKPQGKLLTVLSGKLFDVALDCRRKSKTYGKHFSIILSAKDNTSLYVPAGFAHGFCSLEDNTILHYKCTKYRHSKSEIGIMWNDPELKIHWPKKKFIISDKDKKNLSFSDYTSKFMM